MNLKSKCVRQPTHDGYRCAQPILHLLQTLAAVVVTGFGVATALPAIAQTYPSKPIRLIVPFPPGGANDIVARTVNVRLPSVLGQNLIIDNRAGAGGRPRAVNRVPACGMRTSASRDARRWI